MVCTRSAEVSVLHQRNHWEYPLQQLTLVTIEKLMAPSCSFVPKRWLPHWGVIMCLKARHGPLMTESVCAIKEKGKNG